MPVTIKDMIDQMNHSGEGGANAVNQKAADKREAALKQYLQGQEPELAGKKQSAQNEANLGMLNDPRLQALVNEGGSAKVGDISLGGNPYAKMAVQGPHEAKVFQGIAEKGFKPINDTLDASKSTLDNLNLGNDNGDKLALINEAKLSLAGSGGRAIGQMVSHLAGDPTMASDAQKALNWLQNTPNVPRMQPAQRDAMRESVFNRLNQTEQQGTQLAAQLGQQGPDLAPHANYNSILSSYTTPAQQKLKQLRDMQAEYTKQRAAMQPGQANAVSQPSQATPNPTTLDRLKSFFGGGSSQSQAQPQAPQQMRVKHKASGQTGTIPANEFDPSIYDQVQ